MSKKQNKKGKTKREIVPSKKARLKDIKDSDVIKTNSENVQSASKTLTGIVAGIMATSIAITTPAYSADTNTQPAPEQEVNSEQVKQNERREDVVVMSDTAIKSGLETAFKHSSKTTYDVTFAGISGGVMTFENSTKNDKNYIDLSLQSAGMLGYFYNVDDSMRTILDNNFNPEQYTVRTNHGGDKDVKKVKRNGDTVIAGSNKQTVNDHSYDLLSILYAMQGIELETGKTYQFEGYEDDELITINMIVREKKKISTFNGYKQAYKVQPRLPNNGELRGILNEDMSFWYDAEKPHTLLQINVPANIGTGYAYLTDQE